MDDQFSEWDRFYETYELSMTADGAMERYKHYRRQKASLERSEQMKRTIAAKKASSSSTQAREAEASSSPMMPWVIVDESSEMSG